LLVTFARNIICNVTNNTKNYKYTTRLVLTLLINMNQEMNYKYSLNIALENAKKRIDLLEDLDKKSIQDEYNEWLSDGYNKESILLLREDPII